MWFWQNENSFNSSLIGIPNASAKITIVATFSVTLPDLLLYQKI